MKTEYRYWRDIAEENGISRANFSGRVRRPNWSYERAATTPLGVRKKRIKEPDYAIYKGDDLIVIGSAKECAEEMNVTIEHIKWMTTPAGQKRIASRRNPENATAAVRLDDDEE